MSLNESNDGFVCVNQLRTRRQKNRNKYKLSEKQSKLLNDLKAISYESESDFKSIQLKIDSSINELKESCYLDNVYRVLERCLAITSRDRVAKIVQIVCYGLGNFSTTIDSLYQLSLILCLKTHLEINDILIFDPIFTENEKKFLENTLNFKIIEKNAKCVHPVTSSSDQMVLFFMPHCDKSLFNNILWSNWDLNRLKNIVIFGNSFEKMLETICSKKLIKKFYKYLDQMCSGFEDVLIEERIENSFNPKQIFNDLSIHVFDGQNLSQSMLEMYYDSSEPTYEENGDVL